MKLLDSLKLARAALQTCEKALPEGDSARVIAAQAVRELNGHVSIQQLKVNRRAAYRRAHPIKG